jgi:hypothetical protein
MRNSDSVNQISSNPVIGVKMEKLVAGDHLPIANSDDGYGMISKYTEIPKSGNFIIVVRNGKIEFVQAPEGDLRIFNNSLGWTETQDCE